MGAPEEPVSAAEQLQAVKLMAALVRPLHLRVLVLGRVALLLRSGVGGATKDVDAHLFPAERADQAELLEILTATIEPGGGRARIEPDGRSISVHLPVQDRLVLVEIVMGGEDWIQQDVLEDAVRTAEEIDGVMVPSLEHLYVMKAEVFVDRRDAHSVNKARQDMVRITTDLRDDGAMLDMREVRRLVLMRPKRKHDRMLDICASVATATGD